MKTIEKRLEILEKQNAKGNEEKNIINSKDALYDKKPLIYTVATFKEEFNFRSRHLGYGADSFHKHLKIIEEIKKRVIKDDSEEEIYLPFDEYKSMFLEILESIE